MTMWYCKSSMHSSLLFLTLCQPPVSVRIVIFVFHFNKGISVLRQDYLTIIIYIDNVQNTNNEKYCFRWKKNYVPRVLRCTDFRVNNITENFYFFYYYVRPISNEHFFEYVFVVYWIDGFQVFVSSSPRAIFERSVSRETPYMNSNELKTQKLLHADLSGLQAGLIATGSSK